MASSEGMETSQSPHSSKTQTSIARDREVYKYFQPVDLDKDECQPRSSSDPCLTAFAQLAALRLNAKRGIISLLARDTHYILAESGRTLSLQQENDEKDRLWHGVGALNPNRSLNAELTELLYGPKPPDSITINDVLDDERFKNQGVGLHQNVRFLTCVPLRIPRTSITIGNFMVVDDVPRDGLEEAELQFLKDMGSTVMDYLEAGRVKYIHYRSERMVKALGVFLEGQDSLREWWLQSGHITQHAEVIKGVREGISLGVLADIEFGHSTSEQTNSVKIPEIMSPPLEGEKEKDNMRLVGSFPSESPAYPETKPLDPNLESQAQTQAFEPAMGLHEATLSNDNKRVFARASNLIREAISVDGVVFFDASIKSFGNSLKISGLEEKPTDNPDDIWEISSASEDEMPEMTKSEIVFPPIADTENQPCQILGYSIYEDLNAEETKQPLDLPQFPERILRKLLKKYPDGHIFNFDDEGVWTSDSDGRDDLADAEGGVYSKMTRVSKAFRDQAALAIRNVFPSARSVAWLPLWNQKEERWLAGTLVWTTSPTRILWPDEELTYIMTFGNSVMAELARLSALNTSQIKTDFISSISHELRSPLHGVLASVEFLQETPMTELQIDMVNNIHDSGKVLLDTINHVLEFSKVESRTSRMARNKAGKRRRDRSANALDGPAVQVAGDVCLLSEEVLNSVYAGRNLGAVSRSMSGDSLKLEALEAHTITVIVNIDYRKDWNYMVDAGAWRRILMNIFSNALKYTRSGYIRVSLRVGESFSREGRSYYTLVLKVMDSGIGISQDFLQHHLCKPFAQEDSLAAGTGLGLSIVYRIVRDLRGHIEFRSEQGTGTEVTVCLPVLAPPSAPSEPGLIQTVRDKTKGLKVCLERFEVIPTSESTDAKTAAVESRALRYLKSSVRSMMGEWFGMDVVETPEDTSGIDLLIIHEVASNEIHVDKLVDAYRDSRRASQKVSMVIVLCSTFALHDAIDEGQFKVFYLHQPFGPYKLAEALQTTFCLESIAGLKYSSSSVHLRTTNPTTSTQVSSAQSDALEMPLLRVPETEADSPTHVTHDIPMLVEQTMEAPEVTSSSRGKALLVDDNEINLKLLAAYMRKLKVDYVTATDGLQAFNAYAESGGQFDIIFMDITMPVMTGTESSRKIRQFESETNIRSVPIVALTGGTSAAAQQEAFRAGIDMFLTKPVAMKTLKPLLEDAREHGRAAVKA